MSLTPIRGRSLPDGVFAQLAEAILTGGYEAGDKLPPERTLVQQLGVNRHVVREALKRLEQVGLLKIAQGGGTTVLDYRKHAGLDMLALLGRFAGSGRDSARTWLSVLEMRAAIGADMARLCAERADQAVRDELVALADELGQAQEPQALYELEVRFWDRVLDGADNLAYRLAFNSMVRGASGAGTPGHAWSARESRAADFRRPLAAAIAAGNAQAAEEETRRTMRAAVAAYVEVAGLDAAGGAPTRDARTGRPRAVSAKATKATKARKSGKPS